MIREDIVKYVQGKVNCKVSISDYSDCANILTFHLEPENNEIVISNNVREKDLDVIIQCIKGGSDNGNC